LFRFFSYGLEKKFRISILREFQELTISDFEATGDYYGVEKFWAYLFFRGDKETRLLTVDPRLKAIMEPFKVIPLTA
jgi:hypothetical protein